MCGAGILIEENSFVGNVGMKRHNGGAGVLRCVRSSDKDDFFLQRGWTSGYKLEELDDDDEPEEDDYGRVETLSFMVNLYDHKEKVEESECRREWLIGIDCEEPIERKYFANPSTSYINVTDMIDGSTNYTILEYGTVIQNNNFINNYAGKKGTALLIDSISELVV